MIGVVLFVGVLVVALVLAFVAGYGMGSAETYAKLRPERIAREMQADTISVLQGMREVHDDAVRALVTGPTSTVRAQRPIGAPPEFRPRSARRGERPPGRQAVG